MSVDPIRDDVPSFEEEETNEYTFDDDSPEADTTDSTEGDTTWEWDGESWRQVG